ncbi:ABC transporter permease [Paenibacillus aceris]|uniref:ABC-type transport system involved in multi-copper enzyme maturation permease subunit n=1 Tax=Paenibacillus aceris TaxID=869555 RepID=A0ABS4HSE0_9BACL|nr:ABC transporter permease [Paenibacillus aceris]MBP1961430.1 ABC-type transport system involved in multi-copper enzyme maturation permease subunit [Paenibacillus aceris]NHW37791.1 ABC transporter permease subunit [Paenibacillus aceris]
MNSKLNWINPVMEKEFRLRMRTFRSPLSILVYLLAIGLIALGFAYINMSHQQAGVLSTERSSELFYFLSGTQLVLIAFMTPGLTAGVVSGEREKQTLNMLLTTQQSSGTIILSKLIASLSFMLLTVVSTMPLYSIVFLYGGVSPKQVFAVFIFYVFVMVLFGAVGIFFSTILKKTVISVIATYGFVLFVFGFTALAGLFFGNIGRTGMNEEVLGYFLSFNPMAVLVSLMVPDFAKQLFKGHAYLQMWHIFIAFYTLLSIILIWLSVRYLRPIMKRKK